MRKLNFIILLILFGMVIFASFSSVRTFSRQSEHELLQTDLVSDYHATDNFLNTTISVNVVFVGFNANSTVINTVNDSLTHWYAPIVGYNYYLGANYTLDISYINAPAQMAIDYFTFVHNNIGVRLAPSFLVEYDPSMSGLNVGVMDADLAETWLYQNSESYVGLENLFDESYTLFILDSYSSEIIGYYRYYNTSTVNSDTGELFIEDFMISWGGHYRFYFIDWSAGPTESAEGYGYGEPVNATNVKPIWDYVDVPELCDAIAEFVDESIGLLFMPSYLYHPTYAINYALQYLFVDATSDDSVIANADSFVDANAVVNAFVELIPYTNWSVNFTAVDIDDPSLTELEAKVRAHPNGSGGYTQLNSSLFMQEFIDSLFGSVVGDPVYVRAIFVIYDDLTYVDGSAWGMGLPWGALMVGYKNLLTDRNCGLTNLAIHENGHVFGLRHPHDGYDAPDNYASDDPDLLDWLYDFQPTPMTYLSPLSGHGASRATFSQFNHDTLDRGYILDLLNRTQYALEKMAIILEDKNYTTLPANVQAVVDEINANWSLCLTEFAKMDYFNKTMGEPDAFSYAFMAWFLGDDVIAEATKLDPFDIASPMIDHLVNISYEEGSTGNILTWQPNDTNPSNYIIYRNTTEVISGSWNGSALSINVDSLAVGTYNYTIVVFDENGNWASDTVIVIVTVSQTTTSEPTTTPESEAPTSETEDTGTVSGFTIAILLVSGLALMITRNSYRRRRRR